MRDIFEDLFIGEPTDPVTAARRAMRPPLRRRFYEVAHAAEQQGGYAVLLDGVPVRTPGRNNLVVPTKALAEAIAAEWQGQADVIDPMRMPHTRLANSIIDGVVVAPEPVAAEIAKYLGSDLLCYRADAPAELVRRQAEQWDPLVAWARDELGARFVLAEGVVPVAQPDHALAAARQAIPENPWRLGAINVVATLTGSAVIALAVARGRVSAEQAWAAAHVDEDWNMEQWGRDELTLERRDFRFAEMQAAATVLRTVSEE
jgi:chaperone required for assembly of F1-ATPase